MMHIAYALAAAGYNLEKSLAGPAGYDYARYFQEQRLFLVLLKEEPKHSVAAECGI